MPPAPSGACMVAMGAYGNRREHERARVNSARRRGSRGHVGVGAWVAFSRARLGPDDVLGWVGGWLGVALEMFH